VAMTRARETLQLLAVRGVPHPHVALLAGDSVVRRELSPDSTGEGVRRHYALLGMEDLFLDFAGVRREEHPARKALSELAAGDRLRLEVRDDQLELVNDGTMSVARLSRTARERWRGRLAEIVEIRVVAMVRRYRQAIGDEVFRQRCHGEVWEVPVVEICYSESAPAALRPVRER